MAAGFSQQGDFYPLIKARTVISAYKNQYINLKKEARHQDLGTLITRQEVLEFPSRSSFISKRISLLAPTTVNSYSVKNIVREPWEILAQNCLREVEAVPGLPKSAHIQVRATAAS